MEKGYIEYNWPLILLPTLDICCAFGHYRGWWINDNPCAQQSLLILKISRMQLLAIIPKFCKNCPKVGYSIYRDNFFCFYVSNFCLDLPFGFLIHQDAHFCLSRPFGFSTYRAILFFLGKVFLDCICVHRASELFTIHSCKN